MRRIAVGAAALAFLAYAAGLVLEGGRFPALGEPAGRELVLLFVLATVGASFLHVIACLAAHRQPPRLFFVLLVGVAGRLIVLFGAPAPILEGDPEALRFDARMVNRGLNPYEFKPAQLGDRDEEQDLLVPGPALRRIARAQAAMTSSVDAPRPEDMDRPDLRSRNTPLVLWITSIADRFKPGSTRGLAFFVLVADVLAIYLLILALNAKRLPLGLVMIYAWCPVLLKEAYCTLSPDAFLMPALAGLVWCIATGRGLVTAVPLAICAGIRFPLLLLAPVLGRRTGSLGVILAAVLFLGPFLAFRSPDVPLTNFVEGHVHVWRHYEYNSMLENPVRAALKSVDLEAEHTLSLAGVDIVRPDLPLGPLMAKILLAVVLVGVVIYLIIRDGPQPGSTDWGPDGGFKDLFLVLAVLLLTSPVLHPWHALWLLPLLVVRPFGVAWLALPGLASLAYLTHLAGPFAADLTVMDGVLSFRIVEYGVFLALLIGDRVWRPRLLEGRIDDPAAQQQAADDEFAYQYVPSAQDEYEYVDLY